AARGRVRTVVVTALAVPAAVAVQQARTGSRPVRRDRAERRHHRGDARCAYVEIAAHVRVRRAHAPAPSLVDLVLPAVRRGDVQRVRHARACHDVAVAVGRDGLHGRGADVDADGDLYGRDPLQT